MVRQEDGSALPGSAGIEISCGGITQTVARTNVLDNFIFQWAAAPEASGPRAGNAFSSASGAAASGFYASRGFTNCELRAELSGFSSSSIHLASSTTFDGRDVGVIWLHRISGAPGDNAVSITTLAAPKAAKKNFDKGRELGRTGNFSAAAAHFQEAVKIYPRFAEAWVDLGFTQYKMRSPAAAESSALNAKDIDPKLAGIYQILGYVAADRQDWNATAHYLEEAERLNPLSSPLPWYISAVAYYQMRRYNEAERSIRQEIQVDAGRHYRRAQFLLGLILVAKNEIARGSQILRDYLASSPDPADVKAANAMLSRLEVPTSR
jgi:tetratricopeptide (TPR) repeat protein